MSETDDPLDQDLLRREAAGVGSRWRAIDVVAETGSTNADLAARVRAGEAPDAVLVTSYQSAGRGRQGRTWTAPPGSGIAMSVSLRPAVAPERWTWLPLLAGLAVAEAVRQTSDLPALVKWPNDVLVGGKKLCGVLVERVEAPSGAACVVGIGVNVSLRSDQLPVPTATSLVLAAEELGAPGAAPLRNVLVAAVLVSLQRVLERWEAVPEDRSTAVFYRERCDTLGRRVRVELAGGRSVEGLAEDVDAGGRLRLLTAAGRQVFGAGDVIHLRT